MVASGRASVKFGFFTKVIERLAFAILSAPHDGSLPLDERGFASYAARRFRENVGTRNSQIK